MKNRNFMDAGIFEKANAFSTIREKSLEEIKIEDFINVMNVCLERLEILEETIKGSGFKEKEMRDSIKTISNKLKEVIEEQTLKLERRLPYEKSMELLKDFDGDGLNNREEIERGLDPFSIDTDRDGINDGEEVKNGDREIETL